jgi:hypothetical protein
MDWIVAIIALWAVFSWFNQHSQPQPPPQRRYTIEEVYRLDPRFRNGHCLPFCKDLCANYFHEEEFAPGDPCLSECMGKCPYDDPENQ